MFQMAMFYNPKSHLTKKYREDDFRSFRNRILEIKKRKNPFEPTNNSQIVQQRLVKNYSNKEMSYQAMKQLEFHSQALQKIHLRKALPKMCYEVDKISPLICRNKIASRKLKEDEIKAQNSLLFERLNKIRRSLSTSSLVLPKIK